MPGPLNRQPLGLLSLFDVKTGRYPSDLGEVILPTLEQTEWMRHSANELIESASFNLVSGALGVSNVQVPATEFWFVDRLSFRVSNIPVGPAQFVQVNPVVTMPPAGPTRILSIGPSVSNANGMLTAAAQENMFVYVQTPIILPPGTTITLFCEVRGAAVPTATVTLKILRLRA